MSTYWALTCVESTNTFVPGAVYSGYPVGVIPGGPPSPGPSCPAGSFSVFDNMQVMQVLPAAVGSDGTVGVGTVVCDSLGVNPTCHNSVSSGTTACGSTGQPGCGPTTTVIGTAEPIDYTVCGEFYAFGLTVIMTIYFTCAGIGEVLKTIRRV